MEVANVSSNREIYFKALYLSDCAPCGIIMYTKRSSPIKFKNLLLDKLTVSFRTKDMESVLSKMEEIEKTKDFVCWNLSDKGTELYEGTKIVFK